MRLKSGFALYLSLLLMAPVPVAAQDSSVQAQAGGGVKPDVSDERAPRVPTFRPEGDLAGELQVFTTEYEDTFAGIGNDLALGYLELVKANPGVDPWLPGDDTTIILPRMYVLPDVRREGIVINLAEYRLYYFSEEGVQVYPVGVGTEENPSPLTDAEVTMPLESPAWYPPASIRAEYEATGDYLPRMIPPGPGNPLGTHALMLSEKGYLIHGTNKRFGVGMPVSHGCFRMYNEDISRFVYQVQKGTPVQVIREPVKLGISAGEVWIEVHRPGEDYLPADRQKLWQQVQKKLESFREQHADIQIKRQAIEIAVDQADGIPTMIGETLTQMAADETHDPDKKDAEAGSEQTLYF
ncbi:MAG: L,D-transpeptidase family protein [Marinobacter sp.]